MPNKTGIAPSLSFLVGLLQILQQLNANLGLIELSPISEECATSPLTDKDVMRLLKLAIVTAVMVITTSMAKAGTEGISRPERVNANAQATETEKRKRLRAQIEKQQTQLEELKQRYRASSDRSNYNNEFGWLVGDDGGSGAAQLTSDTSKPAHSSTKIPP